MSEEFSHHYSDTTDHQRGAQSTPVVIPRFRFVHSPSVGFSCIYTIEEYDVQAREGNERDKLNDKASQKDLDKFRVSFQSARPEGVPTDP